MICIVITFRGIQVLFSILYNPYASSFILVPGGQRTRIITQTGYLQSATDQTTTIVEPTLIQDNVVKSFQEICHYGRGQCVTFAHQKLIAAFDRIQTIQYIGSLSNLSEATNITNRIDTITTLAPLRSYPYSFAVLIGPRPKSSLNANTKKDNTLTPITWKNTIMIGEVGIRMICDNDKITAIKNLSAGDFISAVQRKDPRYRGPCPDYRLPQILAFDYYYYLDDNNKAIDYYKITAMHDDVPSISIKMPAILARHYGIVTLYK